ncbi:hypothetical protein HYV84_01355 [Candidatus Woesearchaeota archaeon]|nr:hypothetical protein [Candidatus Woesearchaeota archaeon]
MINELLEGFDIGDKTLLGIILIGILIWIIGFLIGVYMVFYGIRLNLYLYNKKRKRWGEIYGRYVRGREKNWFRNFRRGIKYLYSNQDCNDKKILFFKKKLRFPYRLFVISFFIFISIVITGFVVGLIFGKT